MKKIILAVIILFIAVPAYADDIADLVRSAKTEGYVSKLELGDIAPTVYVRPKFHEIDFDFKRTAAWAFLEYAKRERPDNGYTFITLRDSRNRNTVGTYDKYGLRLTRSYR